MLTDPISAAIDFGKELFTRFIPDPAARAEAERGLIKMAQDGELEKFRIEVSDRDSARKREIEVKDRMPATLALLSLALFAAALWALLSGQVDKSNAEVVYLLLGTLNGIVGTVFAYYFGTTRSSQQKNNILGEALKK
jgi:uncharacterized membrane protein